MLRCPGMAEMRRTTSFRSLSDKRVSCSPIDVTREASDMRHGLGRALHGGGIHLRAQIDVLHRGLQRGLIVLSESDQLGSN